MMHLAKTAIRTLTPLCVKKTLARMALSNGLEICVADLVANGFAPKTVIDVGAYEGEWTKTVGSLMPHHTPFLMIEAQAEKQPILEQVASQQGYLCEVEIALLYSEPDQMMPFYVMETGSSIYPENTVVPRKLTTIRTKTLDAVVAGRFLVPPFFLKLDVQGAELDVLRGGMDTLRQSDAVLLEVAVAEYNQGAPQIEAVLRFMTMAGFVIHDIVYLHRHYGALVQLDVLFRRPRHWQL